MTGQSDQQDEGKSETVNTRPEFMRQKGRERGREGGKETASQGSNGKRNRHGKTEKLENKQTD